MGYQFVKIDGQDVEKNLAAAFKKWAAAFKKRTGQTLHVRSGRRSTAVQQKGYNDYRAGRTSTKWAKPDESNHCDAGPKGPCALDVYDSGKDNGVTVKGTKRWHDAVETGKEFGFTWGGWGVPDSEGWHFENHAVKLGSYGSTAPRYPLPAGSYFGPRFPLANKRSVSGYYSHSADLKKWQQRMHDRGWTIEVDGRYDPQTGNVAAAFQREKGLNVDRLIGPQTWKAAWTEPVT